MGDNISLEKIKTSTPEFSSISQNHSFVISVLFCQLLISTFTLYRSWHTFGNCAIINLFTDHRVVFSPSKISFKISESYYIEVDEEGNIFPLLILPY